MKNYALVTGAGKGLGLELAKQLASRNYPLILVSLPGENILLHADQISRIHHVNVEAFEIDLSNRASLLEFIRYVNEHYEIEVLINNAGTGGSEAFQSSNPDKLLQMIDVNITATVLCTRLLWSNLSRRKQAWVLNVASMAAFSPVGYETVYPASKAFVHSFSRGLFQEFANRNVFVSVVNPGPMPTSEAIRQRIQKHGWWGSLGCMVPEDVAKCAIKQLFKKDTVIILNKRLGFLWLLMKIVPIWIRLPLMTNAVKKEIESPV